MNRDTLVSKLYRTILHYHGLLQLKTTPLEFIKEFKQIINKLDNVTLTRKAREYGINVYVKDINDIKT